MIIHGIIFAQHIVFRHKDINLFVRHVVMYTYTAESCLCLLSAAIVTPTSLRTEESIAVFLRPGACLHLN